MVRYHVGVDVSKRRHYVSIRDLSQGNYCKAFSFTNDHDGFMELVEALDKLSHEKSDFLIGVEACSFALNLSYLLMAMGFNLVEVNPFRAGQFRKSTRERGENR